MDDRRAPPPGRYGDPGRARRRGIVAAVVVLAVAFGAWLLWAALSAANPDVRSTLVSFRIVDPVEVRVRLEVIADRHEAVTCTVRARDRFQETVGLARATVPPGADDRRTATVAIDTRSRASGASLVGCRLTDD